MKSIHLLILGIVVIPAFLRSAEETQAKVTNGVKEADLATVTLTPSAEKRLAIVTEPIELKSIPATRLYGGELVFADPVKGDGQSVFSLLSQMTPADRLRLAEEQINADGILESVGVELEAADLALNRAEELLNNKVGTTRSVDEAKARRDLATAALEAAQAKRTLLGPPILAAQAPMTLWVKVPVYVGDLERIDSAQKATVGRLDGRPDDAARTAKPVAAPPSADPFASTVDLFYEIDNPDRKLQPGQRVGVTVPLMTDTESLVAPHAAILYDINGGTWVYESLGEQVYTFRRVQVSRVAGDRAVLASGPKPGTQVVTDGAAELFGTEFGVGK